MSENETNQPVKPRLVPARPPNLEAEGGYLPRLPWRYLGIAALVLGLVLLGNGYRQEQRAEELRASILQRYDALAPQRATMTAAREKLERLIVSAANSGNETVTAPDFRFADLRNGRSLYLRIPQASAGAAKQIVAATKEMEPDWIPSCLGLNPSTAREIYEIGEFLTPGFVANLRDEGVMKLRVREDTLVRRGKSDLQNLLDAASSRWFMLVLQEGPSRHDDPVRVFIWDLQTEKLLLATRVQSQGILLTSHILSQGVDPKTQPKLGDRTRATANDCSIAAGIRKLSAAR